MTTTPIEAHAAPSTTEAKRPHGRPLPMHELQQRRLTTVLLWSIALLGVAAGVGIMTGFIANPFHHTPGTSAKEGSPHAATESDVPSVKVVQAKQDSSAEVVLERIATVEPYYRADLRARASGIVKTVFFDIGDTVLRGDVLIQIDVAEFEQDVAQKQALILQRRQEVKVSEAKVKDAQAGIAVAAAAIAQKKAEVQAFTATRDLKKRKLDRYQDLADRGSVVGNIVEEEERDYLASDAAVLAATSNVARAEADHAEATSKLEAAQADVELKLAQIQVAQTDLERAKVIANYGKVIAPFDGVVVRRNVDPGSFVQNATSGSSETLISISRIDLVTVVSQFPDNVAPYISPGTSAVIQIADLSGSSIFSTVTRYSPGIQDSDRTMRIEIDLFNGSVDELTKHQHKYTSGELNPHLKGSGTTFPAAAFPKGQEPDRRLLPGMNGSIKLSIGGSGHSTILPSTCVYSRSGATYILTLSEGRTRQVPVRIHMNDGKQVRLSIVKQERRKDGTEFETLSDLSGEDQVVLTNQLQIGDDVEVSALPTKW